MFVHLRCHSHYSFLRGVNPPEEIIAATVEQKMPAVALTDMNGMYAAVPFYQAARAAGVKPIVGVVLEVGFPQANGVASIPRLRAGKTAGSPLPSAPLRASGMTALRAWRWCCWRRMRRGTAICAS